MARLSMEARGRVKGIIRDVGQLQVRGTIAQCPFCLDRINVRGVMTHIRFKHPEHAPDTPIKTPLKAPKLGKKGSGSVFLPPSLTHGETAHLLHFPTFTAKDGNADGGDGKRGPVALELASFEEGLRMGLKMGQEIALTLPRILPSNPNPMVQGVQGGRENEFTLAEFARNLAPVTQEEIEQARLEQLSPLEQMQRWSDLHNTDPILDLGMEAAA